MRRVLPFTLLITIGLVGFIGYWYALIDWAGDVPISLHGCNLVEVGLEAMALGAYTYLALRFLRRRLTR